MFVYHIKNISERRIDKEAAISRKRLQQMKATLVKNKRMPN